MRYAPNNAWVRYGRSLNHFFLNLMSCRFRAMDWGGRGYGGSSEDASGSRWRRNICPFLFSLSLSLISSTQMLSSEVVLKAGWHGHGGSCMGSTPSGCRDFSLFQLALGCRWGDVFCGALVQFGCYISTQTNESVYPSLLKAKGLSTLHFNAHWMWIGSGLCVHTKCGLCISELKPVWFNPPGEVDWIQIQDSMHIQCGQALRTIMDNIILKVVVADASYPHSCFMTATSSLTRT